MNIIIPIGGNSIYGYAFEVDLSLDSTHLMYGYGYGEFPAYYPSYFDVFYIEGDLTGYGIESLSGYQYGWGYEYTTYISGDGSDIINITATVTDNGQIPDESNIPVLFTGPPGVTFGRNIVYTDSNGQATTTVQIDSSVLRNLDIKGASVESGPDPKYITPASIGYMLVEATIPKCMVTRDWDVVFEIGGTQAYGTDLYDYISLGVIGYGLY